MDCILVVCEPRFENNRVLLKLKNDYRYNVKKGDLVKIENLEDLFEVIDYSIFFDKDEVTFIKNVYGDRPIHEITKIYNLNEIKQ